MKKLKYFLAYSTFIFIINQCNTEEICYGNIGYKNPDGCYVILALYASSSEEEKKEINLPLGLYTCIDQLKKINDCKKQSKYWPLPNEIVD
jgi:hypothetical protein